MTVSNSTARVREGIRWLLLAAFPAVAFAVLLSMVQPLAFDQLGNSSLEEALLTTGRWLGLALTFWLIISQLLFTLAVLTRTDWMIEVLQPVTLPIVRRIAASAATISITVSSVTAVAQTAPEPTIMVVDDVVDGDLRQEATPTPVLEPRVEHDVEEPRVAMEPEGSYSAPLTWQVRPGDHLWSIAGEHLTIVLDRPPTRDEHRNYWVEVVESARPIIRSGDPNLIYPGEEIPMPPMLDAGITP